MPPNFLVLDDDFKQILLCIKMINIPGHCDGLCAVKITREDGKYVLFFSDGGYATKSWKEMITSGVSLDKEMQRKSLMWIREQSMDANCIESLATHDTDIKPHVIELSVEDTSH